MASTIIDQSSPNCGPRKTVNGVICIRQVIVHYTGMQSCDQALSRLCDETSNVSAHYLIDEDGSVFRMVPEDMRAWHAGVSYWGGVRDLNSTSIGIELVNPGHEFGYRAFPGAQLDAFAQLALRIMELHNIGPEDILGHSDIAPGRKIDPGELFPWKEMAGRGIGTWAQDAKSLNRVPEMAVALEQLSAIGYAVPSSPDLGADILDRESGAADVIAAFQRRYRQAKINGALDLETSKLIASISS
jgi:N-acetylmuramoyl-L-alanine amidase